MAIAWIEIEQLFQRSSNNIKLQIEGNKNTDAIERLGVSERSVLGQVLINLASVEINNYLRVLGKSDEKNGIFSFNDKMKKYFHGNKLIVAYDVWGGLFAIGNGDFEGDIRTIWYYAPDMLQWECLGINYAEFIAWACSENIKEFYKKFFCGNVEFLLKKVRGEEAILVYPFLWSKECNIENADKKVVPIEEIVALNIEYEKRMYNKR